MQSNRMGPFVPGFVCLLLSAFAPAAGAATLVFDSMSSSVASSPGGNLLTFFNEADQFQLSSTATIDHIRLWSTEPSTQPFTGGDFNWTFYSDAGGVPGLVVASGTGTSLTRSYLFTDTSDFQTYSNDFDITAVTLASGTYWLGLQVSGTSSYAFYWAIGEYCPSGTCSDGTAGTMRDDLSVPGVQWDSTPVPVNYAYQLWETGTGTATPEPVSLALCGVGLLAISALARRKCR